MWTGFANAFYSEQLVPADPKIEWFRRLTDGGPVRIDRRDERLPDPRDASRPTAERARAWLHANCAHCHRVGAGGSVQTLLSIDLAVPKMRIAGERPLRGDFGLPDGRVVAPGDPYRSALYYRISTEGLGHMPMIGSRLVDVEGARLVRDWIASLGPAAPAPEPSIADVRSALALVDRIADGRDAKAAAAAAERAAASPNPAVRGLFERFLPPQKRRRVLGIGFEAREVLSLRGDPARGKELFGAEGEAQCARCHKAEGVGREVGPPLAGLAGKYPPADLLDQIVNPSKIIAPEFTAHAIEMKDGLFYRGFVLRRTAEATVLRTEEGGEVSLAASEIASDRPSAVSQMPEGLLAPLTAQEAADLLAYLRSIP
jgi:putative heme-binding domain-containing protein